MNIFNSIKSRISILQVINDYTTLKRAGTYWKGSCPFHHERTASFTVTPHKEIFYCFGCHAGGDVIAFIARAENCSQIEAARHLAETYQIDLPEEVTWGHTEQHAEERRRYYELCELVATWCESNLAKHPAAQTYVQARSISEIIRKKFKVGYFPSGQTALKSLLQAAKKENFLANDLIQARIILEGKSGLYSPFEDRIMFPIKEHMGNICGFGGRVFQSDDTRAKYYNSHDHQFFNKGSLLFGFDQAKKQIQTQNSVFLVEGYIDCIAMVQAGFTNTIATLGTACSTEHLHTLSRYAQTLYVVYDGDSAGKKALIRLSELCWATNMELRIIALPEKEDPASFLEKKMDLTPLIAQAKDIFSWYLEHTFDDFSQKPVPERLTAIKELLAVIAKIPDPLKQDLLMQRAAAITGVSPRALQQAMSKEQAREKQGPGSENRDDSAGTTPSKTASDKASKNNFILEKQIFYAILNNNNLISEEDEKFLMLTLPQPLGAIFDKFQRCKRATPDEEFSTFFNTLDEREQEIVSKILVQLAANQDPQMFSNLLEQLQKKQWKIMVNDVKIKLAQAQQRQDTEGVQKIIAEFQSLKQKMLEKGLL